MKTLSQNQKSHQHILGPDSDWKESLAPWKAPSIPQVCKYKQNQNNTWGKKNGYAMSTGLPQKCVSPKHKLLLIWYKIDLGFTVAIRRICYLSNMKPSVE